MPGRVRHDTFYNLHEVFNKLNSYTTRLVKYQPARPSIGRGVISAIGAFFKWYLFSGAASGQSGAVTGLYATAYSFEVFQIGINIREKSPLQKSTRTLTL